jgi:enoyl-CoA hydratase
MSSPILAKIQGHAGLLTLNRARALNALSLPMIRGLSAALLAWRDDPAVQVVAIRGTRRHATSGLEEPFGAFCAGGDIRFFHQAALSGNPELEDFFTEEYTLNHLVHRYPKPVLAFMDGVVMGGGMGIAQGARVRIATERTKMAMPETHIGLFPDVGGGYFLSRCPGHLGEYLALTGQALDGRQAVLAGLADGVLASGRLDALWASLGTQSFDNTDAVPAWVAEHFDAPGVAALAPAGQIDTFFGLPTVAAIVQALEAAAETDAWARATAVALRQRSPLMLHVTLEQIRRARGLGIADELRMERGLVRHSFHPAHLARTGAATDTVEGIRALAVDKDHAPRWNPARIEDVTAAMVQPFFESPWPAQAHPLRGLA